ncbi:MAG: hypothetical protein ACKVZH_14480 [Blastocatellia bacterium]
MKFGFDGNAIAESAAIVDSALCWHKLGNDWAAVVSCGHPSNIKIEFLTATGVESYGGF